MVIMLGFNKNRNNNNKSNKTSKKKFLFLMYGFLALAVILVVAIVIKNRSHGAVIPANSQITDEYAYVYNLTVSYESSSVIGVTMETIGNTVHVTDVLPNSLDFMRIGTVSVVEAPGSNNNCSIVPQEEGNNKIVRDGVVYDQGTRTVSFDVLNLNSDCTITVPIKVKVNDTTAKEVYNYASASEGNLTINSNLFYNYVTQPGTSYDVSYQYTIIENSETLSAEDAAPYKTAEVPPTMSFTQGSLITVMPNLSIPGYTFSGWTTSDADVSGGTFSMPPHEVVFSGSFTKNAEHTVHYDVSGAPAGYSVIPDEEYAAGEIVTLDSIKANDIIDGYKFSGWTIESVNGNNRQAITIPEGSSDFTMPDADVVITGSFVKADFTVSYAFYDTVLPPNADTLLPATTTHAYGDTVNVAANPTDPTGYKFLGWYSDPTFTMPNEDVVIYGEWKQFSGTFGVAITLNRTAGTGSGTAVGDQLTYQVTIQNSNPFPINNMIIKDYLLDAEAESTYRAAGLPSNYALVPTVPANSNFYVNFLYTISESDAYELVNTVEVLSANGPDYYELSDGPITATHSQRIDRALVNICQSVITDEEEVPNVVFQYHMTSGTTFDTWFSLRKDECIAMALDDHQSYTINQIVPQEFPLTSTGGSQYNSSTNVLTLDSSNQYGVSFNNSYTPKGYMHSFGSITNKIVGGVQ